MFITLTFLPSASGLNLSTGSPRHEEITRLPSNTSHLNEFMIGFDTVTVTIYKCLIMYYTVQSAYKRKPGVVFKNVRLDAI